MVAAIIKKCLHKSKKNWKISLVILLVFMNLSNIIFGCYPYILGFKDTETMIFCEVEQLNFPNNEDFPLQNKYVACATPLTCVPAFPLGVGEDFDENKYLKERNRIFISDESGKIEWEYGGLYFPHAVEMVQSEQEILENKCSFLIVNTIYGGIEKVSYPDKSNTWHWLPENINWTEKNSAWDDSSYLMSYGGESGYYLINDVDFIKGSDYGDSYDSLLISLKNPSLVVLVNYTAEMEEFELGDSFGNASNIYWHYGADPGSIFMNRQHNPDLLPNGNLLVADSEYIDPITNKVRSRIIEVNRTTKKIVWSIFEADGKELVWAKDCNYMPETDSFIICDTGNSRIFEITRDYEVIWVFTSKHILLPFSSQLLENGNILISGSATGCMVEITRESNNEIVWVKNFNSITSNGLRIDFFFSTIVVNCLYLMLNLIGLIIQDVRKVRREDIKKYKDYEQYYRFLIRIILTLLFLFVIIFAKTLYIWGVGKFMKLLIQHF